MTRLEALARRARTEPSSDLHAAWKEVAVELEADLAARERHAMLNAHRGLAHREHAKKLAQEHAAIRAVVEEIEHQTANRRPRAATFDLLADILRGRPAIEVPPDDDHLS